MLIRKNGVVLNVTKGAYKASFATMGWERVDYEEKVLQDDENTLINHKIAPNEEENEKEFPFNMLSQEDEEIEEEMEEDEEEIEIPLTEMTIKELEDLAEEYGVDLGKATKKKDIIEVISKALYSEE